LLNFPRWESHSPPVLEGLSVSTDSCVGGVMVSLVVPLAPPRDTPGESRLVPRLSFRVGAISGDLNGVAILGILLTSSLPASRLCLGCGLCWLPAVPAALEEVFGSWGVFGSWFCLDHCWECGCKCRSFRFDRRRASRSFPQVAYQSVRLVPLCGVPLIDPDLKLLCVVPQQVTGFFVGFGHLSAGCLWDCFLLHGNFFQFLLRPPLRNWSWAMANWYFGILPALETVLDHHAAVRFLGCFQRGV